MNADLVIPSLDAGDEAMFRRVNRPHKKISFEKLLAGLVEFRRMFRGQYWLEVLLLGNYGGMNRSTGQSAPARLAEHSSRDLR
jgi:wyosine [tRNA(Phe)-imidazoG37] synthetase (radical SAM superfamily)